MRAPLWEIGADFGHGTGHGVGFFLSVHEGPVSISPRAPVKESSRVVPGLVLSNEPGLYRAEQYGIRTENLVTPVVDETMLSAMQPMLRMQTLSLAPIETRLIKTAMMRAPYGYGIVSPTICRHRMQWVSSGLQSGLSVSLHC